MKTPETRAHIAGIRGGLNTGRSGLAEPRVRHLALILDHGATRQTSPLQRHVHEFGADVRRVTFRSPLFQFHCLGEALCDRKHHQTNRSIAILVPR